MASASLGACTLSGAIGDSPRCDDLSCEDANRSCAESSLDESVFCGECLPGYTESIGGCVPTVHTYAVHGKITGLVGEGLVLLLEYADGEQSLSLGPGATTFSFSKAIANGGDFAISVGVQPNDPGQTCIVVDGIGTIYGCDVSFVEVNCLTGSSGIASHLAF